MQALCLIWYIYLGDLIQNTRQQLKNIISFRPGLTESAQSTTASPLMLFSYDKPFLEKMQMLAARNLTTKNEIRNGNLPVTNSALTKSDPEILNAV